MIKVLQRYYADSGEYQGIYILLIKFKRYGIGWFTDCGDWFFYVYLGKHHTVRFSSAGHYIR